MTSAHAAAAPAAPKFAIGANVLIALLAAAGVLIAVNFISAKKFVRRDVGAHGSYGLSDRTKSILTGSKGDINLSTLFLSSDEDDKQRGYINRLQDYCDELQRFAPNVKVTHISSPMQREKLVARISSTFGGEAGKHKECLDAFNKLDGALKADFEQRLQEGQKLMNEEKWLGDFPIFASIVTTLKSDNDTLKKAADEIRELTPPGGIPKYSEATTKAKTAIAEVKTHLEAIAKRLAELSVLAGEATKPDSKRIAMLRDVAAQSRTIVGTLRETVGSEGSEVKNVPAALKAFADRSSEVGSSLDALVSRVDQFGKAFPMVKQHPSWSAAVQMGPLTSRLEVADVFQEAAQALAKSRLVILGAIDSKDPNEMARALAGAQRNVSILEKNAQTCEKLLTDLAARLTNLDPESKALLDAAHGGKLFADRLAAIDALDKQITALPELKLGSVADRLKEDNSLVIEANGKIRVVGFNDVWPVRESVAGPSGKQEELARTFNGDSAISTALLALTSDKPIASVMFVSFEPPAPQQRSPFMPPPATSWIPSTQLSEARKRLEAANFKAVDWNLATTKEEPKGEEGIPKIYVFLPPPPPAQQNPFGGQPPEKGFGEGEREIVRKLLDGGAAGIFTATWEVRSGGMMGGPPNTPPYGYNPLLEKDWGIKVENARRIVWLEPDRQKANSYGVVPRNFVHMPTLGFTDQAIGAPMKGTRMLTGDPCNLIVSKDLPKGVSVQPIITIPNRENYIGAMMSDLIYIIDEVQNPNSDGTVTLRNPPTRGPFDMMLAAERKDGDKNKGKIVVMSFGGSLRDDYLSQKVWSGGNRLRLDPEPTENADLFVNSLYWLAGKEQWIARGPAAVPRVLPIEATQAKLLRLFVWGIWPALVFAPGIFFWYIRRR